MNIHIFIIDDDSIFRLLTKKMIELTEISSLIIHECENGKIGHSSLINLKNTKETVIIFLDINMPVLNGWGFLEKLIQNKYYNIKNITIYIVTSSTDQRDKLQQNRYDIVEDFIPKPMNFPTIKELIMNVVTKEEEN